MTKAEHKLYEACDKALDEALEKKYQIYCDCSVDRPLKSYDEWLNS